MRRMVKKPLTQRAALMILAELQRFKTAGHDPNAALDQSTNHCWADVYPATEKPIEAAASSDYEKTQAYMREQEAHRKGIRRVS